jgi:hypothetical protein
MIMSTLDPRGVTRLRRAVYRRMLRQLRASVEGLGEEELLEVAEAPTLAESVARVVMAVPHPGAGADGGWAEELLRGAAARQELLREAGGCYSPAEAAAVLGVSVQAVHQRRRRQGILAVPLASGEWGFPVRQFGAGGRVRTGLPSVLRAFPAEAGPWTVLSVLLSPHPAVEGAAPLDRLDDPSVALAMEELARSYGAQGAT